MRRTCKRAATAAVSVMLCASLLTSPSVIFAETILSDLNGDGVIDVFDYVLSKRESLDASAPIYLTFDAQEGAPGSIVTIPVNISENTGCCSLSLSIGYSPELTPASADGASYPAVIQPAVFAVQHPQVMIMEDVSMVHYASSMYQMCADNGTLFTVSFLIPEDAEPGTTYTLSFSRQDILDADDQPLTVLPGRGTITVTEPAEDPPVEDPPVEDPPVTPYIRTGIDISVWQGDVDMTKLPDDIFFVMIRAGYGRLASQEDKRFAANYNKAKAAGIPVGAYWYSYAMTPDEARLEAQACMQVLGDRAFEYPIAYDVEESKTLALGKAQVSAIITAFCEEMEAAGYFVTLYMSAYYLSTLTTQTVRDDYDFWVAHYNVSAPGYTGSYGMWQYSSTGKVSGISGDVDMDYSYRNYPEIMVRAGLNGY